LCLENALKLTYRYAEFQNFPREDPGAPLTGRRGRERWEGKGGDEPPLLFCQLEH